MHDDPNYTRLFWVVGYILLAIIFAYIADYINKRNPLLLYKISHIADIIFKWILTILVSIIIIYLLLFG